MVRNLYSLNLILIVPFWKTMHVKKEIVKLYISILTLIFYTNFVYKWSTLTLKWYIRAFPHFFTFWILLCKKTIPWVLFLHYRDYFAKVVTNLNVILKILEGDMDKYSGIERFCKQISILWSRSKIYAI